MTTQEDQPFLNINGVQLQSAQSYNLLPELDTIAALGVDILRINPQLNHTEEIVRLFHECVSGQQDTGQAREQLLAYTDDVLCDGYWHGSSGIDYSGILSGNLSTQPKNKVG